MSSGLTLIMTLVVKDEVDIIGANIKYHLARGVDRIIITDNGSTDGTLDVINPYVADDVVELLHEPAGEFKQSEWVSRMAEIAYHKYGADWVIHSDTDEFWWPESNNLKSLLADVPEKIGGLYALRYDFLPPLNSPSHFYDDMTMRETSSKNFYGRPLPPKVVHRGSHGVRVLSGNHDIDSEHLGSMKKSDDISVFHFPMRSYEQYERKVIKGGESYKKTFKCSRCVFAAKIWPVIKRFLPCHLRRVLWPSHEFIGPFWFRLYEIYEKGLLRDYYNKLCIDGKDLEREIELGNITIDKRFMEFMHNLK